MLNVNVYFRLAAWRIRDDIGTQQRYLASLLENYFHIGRLRVDRDTKTDDTKMRFAQIIQLFFFNFSYFQVSFFFLMI